MLERMKTMPEMSDLLEKVNFDDFYSAMENRAKNLLNGYFWAELAMYFANPERIVEGFFIRHQAFRVRIDDVQHFLSGFVLYSNYLERRKDFPAPAPSQALLEGRAEGTGVFNIQSTSQTETSDLSSDANLNISETNKIIPDEKIDPIPSPPPLISDKNETLPPLRVGILRKNRGFFHPQNTLYAMFYTAKHFNIELALFSPQKINFSDKSIQADFLENGKWITKKISFPKIVDNSILYGSDGEILKNLEKYSYLVRHSLNTTKQKVYDLLLQDGQYEEFLIKSHTVNSYEEFCNLFYTYHEDIILKPLRGARGIGVAHIFKDNETGSLVVNAKNNNYYLTWEDFAKFYQEHFVHRKHILQPYIKSRTHAGNPFDIRIHCRRGAEGKFKVSPFPRIGNAKGVVSNIASGGFSMKFNTFLQVEFGDDWKKIYDKLMDFGRTFPDYYQSFYATTIFDIGVDMGIQKHGDTYEFKIFEVNTYIDGPFFEIEDAITHFEYYRYLSEKLGINSSQDSSKKNSDNPIPPPTDTIHLNTLPSTEIDISSSSVTTQDFFEQIDACTSVEEINKISAHYKEEWLISKFWEAFFKVLTSTSELEKARAMSKCRYINQLYSSSIPITSRIKRFLTPHGFSGIFISAYAKIGSGCVLFQNVTVGSNTSSYEYFSILKEKRLDDPRGDH